MYAQYLGTRVLDKYLILIFSRTNKKIYKKIFDLQFVFISGCRITCRSFVSCTILDKFPNSTFLKSNEIDVNEKILWSPFKSFFEIESSLTRMYHQH